MKWLDYPEIDYFGVGPDTLESARTDDGVTATHAVAHATLRPFRWIETATSEEGQGTAFTLTWPAHQPAVS